MMHQQNARNGKAIEEVGTYDPMMADKSKRVVLKLDRIDIYPQNLRASDGFQLEATAMTTKCGMHA